jgi:hypothetical protein
MISRQENIGRAHGPTTAAGKARTRLNSFRHGMFAKAIPLWDFPGFLDRQEYDELVNQLTKEFHPQTQHAVLLVEALALEWFKLGRLYTLELLLLDQPPIVDHGDMAAVTGPLEITQGKSAEEYENEIALVQELLRNLQAGKRSHLPDNFRARLVDEIWGRIQEAEERAESAQAELEQAAEEETRRDAEQWLQESLKRREVEGLDAHGVKSRAQVKDVLSGKAIAEEHVLAWTSSVTTVLTCLNDRYRRACDARRALAEIRTKGNLLALRALPKLTLLGQYTAIVRRNIERLTGMLQPAKATDDNRAVGFRRDRS